jgi:hypothetical protein
MSDRCSATNGRLRCALRPHPVGDHVALVPEGEPGCCTETWARGPSDGPTLADWAAGQEQTDALRAFVAGRRSPSGEAKARSVGMGFTGDTCSNCGSMRMVRTGTCSTCQECGTTSGCG